jgi:uncharacterized membrane protein
MTLEHTASIQAERDANGVERLVLFTDAVVAIIITLMVLEVKPPSLPHHANDAQLGEALISIWPKYLAVFISFMVVGQFWSMHHRRFAWVPHVTPIVVWLNLVFLLLLATVPFVTAVLAEQTGRLSTIVYAADLTIVSATMLLLWMVLGRDEKIKANAVARREMEMGAWAALATALLFLASIGIALFNPTLARYSWVLVLFANVLVRWLYRRSARKLSPPAA